MEAGGASRRRRKTGLLVVLVASAALVTSCSSPSTAQRRAGCVQLTRANVNSIVGRSVAQTAFAGQCGYGSLSGPFIAATMSNSAEAHRQFTSLIQTAHAPSRPGSWSLGGVDGLPAIWMPHPSSAGGGGRLVSLGDGYEVFIDVDGDFPNPTMAAMRAMHDVFVNLSRH